MKNILFLTLLFFTSLFCSAQNDSTFVSVHGALLDYVTHKSIEDKNGVTVSLLDTDSIEIVTTQSFIVPNLTQNFAHFLICINKPGNYILKFENNHYHTLYKKIALKFDSKTMEIDLGDFLLKRRLSNVLSEVECIASKVKFYFRKDTLIYNADAFITQYGFVLEEILKKMPGAVLRDNGEIEVNGNKVDALLLNGKDFFNRDRKTLLRNLPAFMIKDVQVFEKTKDTTSLIKREREFQGYVMDIKLKKEYKTILLGNLDLAYGTDTRYYAKLFGMKFSQIMRISSYVVSNNINKNEWLSSDGRSRESRSGDGTCNRIKSGFSYDFDQPRGFCSLSGTIVIDYSDTFLEDAIAEHKFYSGEEVFSRQLYKANNYIFSAQTNHRFYLLGNTDWDFTVIPALSYKTRIGNGTVVKSSAIHDINDLWGESWRDSLMSMEQSNAMSLYGISHIVSVGEYSKDELRTSVGISKSVHLSPEQNLAINANFDYNRKQADSFDQKTTQQFQIDNFDYRNLYKKQYSEDNLINAEIRYVLNRGNNELQSSYSVTRNVFNNENSLYALHELTGWDLNKQLGLLPSHDELLNILDSSNSYSYTQNNAVHTVKLKYSYSFGDDSKRKKIYFEVPWKFENRILKFHQLLSDTTINRSRSFPDCLLGFSGQKRYSYHHSVNYGINYSLHYLSPSLFNLVNFTDNENSLFIVKGNPNLSDMCEHRISGNFSSQNEKGYIERLSSVYSTCHNQVGHSVVYDPESGITETKPMNINGNWSLSIDAFNTLFVTGNRMSKVNNEVKISWRNSADYISRSIESLNDKREVLTFGIDEKLSLLWSSNDTKLHAEGSAYINFSRSTSTRNDFCTIDVYSYGLQGNVSYELPHDFLLKTDVISVCRKGYNASDMNDQEYIWNANLTKKFGEHYSLNLECYDILNQRKSIYHYINAQGSTNRISNNMRRYLMLHFTVRFNEKGSQHKHSNHHH